MTKKQGKHWVMITLNKYPRIGFAGASQEIQWETGTSDSSSRPWPPWGHRCACIVAALTVELTRHLKNCRSSMSICLILWTYLEDPIGYPVTLWGGGHVVFAFWETRSDQPAETWAVFSFQAVCLYTLLREDTSVFTTDHSKFLKGQNLL